MIETALPIITDCKGCGACCLHMHQPPFDVVDETDDDPEWRALPEDLRAELESDDREGVGLPCLWLDLKTMECKHYDNRPACCRDFVPGSDLCLEDRELAGKGIA